MGRSAVALLSGLVLAAGGVHAQSRGDDESPRPGVGVSTGNAAVDAALGASLEEGAASASARTAQRAAALRAVEQASAASAGQSSQNALRDALLREAAQLAARQKEPPAQANPEDLPIARRVDTAHATTDDAGNERWRSEVKSLAALLREYREWLLAGVLLVSGVAGVVSLSRALGRGGVTRRSAPVPPPAPRTVHRSRRGGARR